MLDLNHADIAIFIETLVEENQWVADLMLIETVDKYKIQTYEELINFICAGRKEKSIRKAIHKKIQNSTMISNKYTYFFEYAICRVFKDSNLVVRAINSSFSSQFNLRMNDFISNSKNEFPYSYTLLKEDALATFNDFSEYYSLPKAYEYATDFNKFDAHTIEGFFLFLTHLYDEKRVVLLMESETTKHEEFSDFLYQISDLFFACNSPSLTLFSKPKLSLENLHDEFLNLINSIDKKVDAKTKYIYTPKIKALEMTNGEYKIELAISPLYLIHLAQKLRNCLASYISFIDEEEIAIFALLKNNIPIGAISLDLSNIQNTYQIEDYSGFANIPLMAHEEAIVLSWAKINNIKLNEETLL